jgi:hypothetical protein
MSKLLNQEYTKNLILEMNGNKVSPEDTSLVIVDRPVFSMPLMPNRSVKVYNSGGSGYYINEVFNKHTVNSHLGLSFDNILSQMIRNNSYTWSLSFLRGGRNLANYINFSYINKDTQQYTSFNFNSNQTIYLYSNTFYMVINSTNKTLTFTRSSLQLVKSSIDARLSSVLIRMEFKVPIKMLIKEHSLPSGVAVTIDISGLSIPSQINTVVKDAETVSYKAIPLDPKLIRVSSYEDFNDEPFDDKQLEGYYYDESGILDVFKDSSKKADNNNLYTSAPRWEFLKEGDNSDIPSWSRTENNFNITNFLDYMICNEDFTYLESTIAGYNGNDINLILCNIVMLFPLNDSTEYSNLPLTQSPIGTANFYIKAGTDTFLLYSYTFSRTHKIGSVPYIPLLDDTEYITLKLNDTTPVNREYILNVGTTYNFYSTAPYSVTLVHNNRDDNTVLRILNGVLPIVSSRTKKVGGSSATFLGYYSSSAGGTQYIDSSRQWVNTPVPGQTLYARWTRSLYFNFKSRDIYDGQSYSIEADKSFVPDNVTLSDNRSIYFYSSQSGVAGSTISRSYYGSVALGSNLSYMNPDTYNLGGGFQWFAYANRLHMKLKVKPGVFPGFTLNAGQMLSVLNVPCNNTKDETEGYTPATNAILTASAGDIDQSTAEFVLTANNQNSFSVRIDYTIYKNGEIVDRQGYTIVPPGQNTVISYLVPIGYDYRIESTQSWDPNSGDNAGKDSVYENTIRSKYYLEDIQTATPTVGTPYCQVDNNVNTLKVSVTNNDTVSAVIKKDGVTLGTLSAGSSATYTVASGFSVSLPYGYNFTITATGTEKTQSTGVLKTGSVSYCYNDF